LSPLTAPAEIFSAVTAPAASLPDATDPFLIFTPVTALLFSCVAPTEFLPRWEAAKAAPPPSTRNTAIVDITFA
jgi:hypothetical protein